MRNMRPLSVLRQLPGLRRLIVGLSLPAGMLFVAVVPGWAQSCALCVKNVAASGSQGIQGLQSGIILLLIPALLLFIGILVFALRYRNSEEEALAEEYVKNSEDSLARVWELPLPQEQAGRH